MNEEVIWKPIPGYSLYMASNTGRIKRISDNKLLTPYECKTSVGTYLNVSVKRDNGNQLTYSTHRLVCMAFHGTPEGYENLDVNHKDLNKHNNNEWNLEWMTRSQNVKHAFQTGANKYALASRMTDLATGDIHEFISMKEVAEFFNLKHKKGFHIAVNHTTKPYLGRYLFEITGDYHIQQRSNNLEVYCLDFKVGDFGRYENLIQLQLAKDLNKGSISTLLREPELRLFNGCVIAKVEDKERLFEYVSKLNQCDIDKSISDYQNNSSRNRKRNDHGWVVKSYLTHETKDYDSTREVASLIGIKNLGAGCGKYDLKLYNGYSVKRPDDPRDFIEYSDDYVQLSLKHDVNGGKPIRVTNLISNTTEDWPSIGSFAKSIGLPNAKKLTRSLVESKLVSKYSFEDLAVTK